MTRITSLDLPSNQMIVLVTGGNPGAIVALSDMIAVAERTDPMAWAGPYQPILHCDSFGVYDANIHTMYVDLAERDPVRCLALFRAVQLGLISQDSLLRAIANNGFGGSHADNNARVTKILASVQARLPSFNQPTQAAT